MNAADELDREYEERVDGWGKRLERVGWLRIGRGAALDKLTPERFRWRAGGISGGVALTARDAVAAVLHAADVDL